MADNKQARGGSDRERIDIHQDYELRDWARKFNATPDQIRDAVGRVGDLASNVEMDLKGSRSTTNADTAKKGEAHPSNR